MKKYHLIVVAAVICTTMTGCLKLYTDPCAEDTDAPYTPARYSISWDDFNSPSQVCKYFYRHDSTLAQHDGDTILLYGYPATTEQERVFADSNYHGFYLMIARSGKRSPCYPPLEIHLGEDTTAEWMIQPLRKIYVEGTIKSSIPPGYSHRCHIWINAIKVDSVKFQKL